MNTDCGLSCAGNQTPLMLAAERGFSVLMRALIEAKADQTAVDKNGRTAVDLLLAAVKLEHGNAGHALLVSRADVNQRNGVRPFPLPFGVGGCRGEGVTVDGTYRDDN